MNREEISDAVVPCSVCGFDKVVSRDGYLYCMECGTRAADTQIIDFSAEVVHERKVKTKIAQKINEADKYKGAWTTWHGYNMILVGLTDELASCCSKQQEFKKCTLKLWGMYLKSNRIAFFTRKQPKYPKLTYGMHARDLEYLYKFKKPAKKRNSIKMDLNDETIPNYKKRKSLIRGHFKEAALSQISTVALASQTLADLTQTDERPNKLNFSQNTEKMLKKHLKAKFIDHHKTVGYCKVGCRCLLKKMKTRITERPYYISIVGLYSIMALALRICDDEVHLGDVLRWCREEHLSYSTYNHFFPEDMQFKKDDPKFKISPLAMSHANIRKTAGLLAKRFKLKGIKAPDIGLLVMRYLKELELPHDLYYYILRLVKSAGGFNNYFPVKESILPNYEGIAMAYIIITIKIIFGLDGSTENEIASSSEIINTRLSLQRQKKQVDTKDFNTDFNEKLCNLNYLFVFKSWMKYIEYRKVCLKYCHYPTKMRLDENDCDDPELFLHHKKTTKKSYEEEYIIKQQNNIVIKSLLNEIVDKYDDNVIDEPYPIFLCSLYPMMSYIEYLIPWMDINSKLNFNRDILEEDFSKYNISFFFNPKPLIRLLSDENIKVDIFKNRHGFTPIDSSRSLKGHKKSDLSMETQKDVVVINVENSKWLQEIRSDKITDILNCTSIKDVISERSRITLDVDKTKISNDIKDNDIDESEKVTINFCHTNYWIRHYDYIETKFNYKSFHEELERKFPISFTWLLKECASVVEMEALDLYKEICVIEKLLKNKNPV